MGAAPLQALHDAVVRPVGRASAPGCGYRRWHLVSIDGSGLDVADEHDNAAAFGRPGASRGASAFPQIRFVSLVENGTHVLFGVGPIPWTGQRLSGSDIAAELFLGVAACVMSLDPVSAL